MRVFVSSSFEDLREHRAAAIRVLRQLGHEVLAMEDMTAGSVAPLLKVLEMVDHSDVYVGIFAWRYGFVPTTGAGDPALAGTTALSVSGATPGKTSITHYEYLRARQRQLPILAFLLDDSHPWPPRLVDGFGSSAPPAAPVTFSIHAFRQALQQERIVSWFTTPSDLEARVSAAITMAGLTRQLDLQPATALDPTAGYASDSSGESGISKAIKSAGEHQRALKIDLKSTWWSTRLYLLAAIAERLTNVRRILVVNSAPGLPQSTPAAGPVPSADDERFIGQISTSAITAIVRSRTPVLEKFDHWLRARPTNFNVLDVEISGLLDGWRQSFIEPNAPNQSEETVKINLSADVLRRWFGDAMLREPVRIADLQRASVIDLLRVLDYPSDFVPVLTPRQPTGPVACERVDVMDKAALNARLARSYLLELMDRARIS